MTTKCVLRVLDAAGLMLGWVEHHAAVRGDGMVRTAHPVRVRLDVTGVPSALSVHWCDVHVEVRVALPAMGAIEAGRDVELLPAKHPLIVVGQPPQALPSVTVGRALAVEVPVGAVGARG